MSFHLIKKFPKTIKSLCQSYGVDFSSLDFDRDLLYLKLTFAQNSYMPLVIETLGDRKISVAYYYEQNGDLIADPEVICYVVEDMIWSPLSILHPPPFGLFQAAQVKQRRISYNVGKQKDIGSFTNKWATNIRDQEYFLKDKPNPEIIARIFLNDKPINDTNSSTK